jgi:hypothetical protein
VRRASGHTGRTGRFSRVSGTGSSIRPTSGPAGFIRCRGNGEVSQPSVRNRIRGRPRRRIRCKHVSTEWRSSSIPQGSEAQAASSSAGSSAGRETAETDRRASVLARGVPWHAGRRRPVADRRLSNDRSGQRRLYVHVRGGSPEGSTRVRCIKRFGQLSFSFELTPTDERQARQHALIAELEPACISALA